MHDKAISRHYGEIAGSCPLQREIIVEIKYYVAFEIASGVIVFNPFFFSQVMHMRCCTVHMNTARRNRSQRVIGIAGAGLMPLHLSRGNLDVTSGIVVQRQKSCLIGSSCSWQQIHPDSRIVIKSRG
jgi:hypothetical protein